MPCSPWDIILGIFRCFPSLHREPREAVKKRPLRHRNISKKGEHTNWKSYEDKHEEKGVHNKTRREEPPKKNHKTNTQQHHNNNSSKQSMCIRICEHDCYLYPVEAY